MIILPIKKKWFDLIVSGVKKEEYREIKPFYTRRFHWEDDIKMRTYMITTDVMFRNGYSKVSPTIFCHVCIKKGFGKKEWGAEPGKLYYVLEITSIWEVNNVKN